MSSYTKFSAEDYKLQNDGQHLVLSYDHERIPTEFKQVIKFNEGELAFKENSLFWKIGDHSVEFGDMDTAKRDLFKKYSDVYVTGLVDGAIMSALRFESPDLKKRKVSWKP